MDKSNDTTHDCLIAFGSNVGDVDAIFAQSIEKLKSTKGIESLTSGEPIRTLPVGGPDDQSEYLNAAIRITTTLDPHALHAVTSRIELELGRERRIRWGSRKADLDILLFDELQFETEQLTIPHPRMSFRRFVLLPASEIAADMIHPVCGLAIGELLERLNNTANKIVIVAPEKTQIEAICKRLFSSDLMSDSHSHWTFDFVSEKASVDQHRDDTKLFAFSHDAPLTPADIELRGSMLRLPESAAGIKTELLAAIEAMKIVPS